MITITTMNMDKIIIITAIELESITNNNHTSANTTTTMYLQINHLFIISNPIIYTIRSRSNW